MGLSCNLASNACALQGVSAKTCLSRAMQGMAVQGLGRACQFRGCQCRTQKGLSHQGFGWDECAGSQIYDVHVVLLGPRGRLMCQAQLQAGLSSAG